MKRLISILLTVCMCFSIGMVLTSCGDNKSHDHTYKTEWAYDDTHHWHACEGEDCTEMSDKAEHTWNDGEITTEATAKADGVKTFTCTICGKTKTEVVKYVVTNADKSGYSVFYSDTSDDAIYLIEHNEAGLPVAVYYDDAFYGGRDEERQLEYSIEYSGDYLISSIKSPYYYYEIEYNSDCTCAYGIAYQANSPKKMENGRTIVISYAENKRLQTISSYNVKGSVTQYIFNEDGRVVRLVDGDQVNLFEYDELGRFVSCTNMDVNDSSVQGTLVFNYEQKASLPSGYVCSEDGVVCYKGTDITYDENAQVLTCTCTYYDGSECDGSMTCISGFDESGRLMNYKETWKEDEEEEGCYTELTYGANGLLNEEAYFDIVGDNKILSSKNSFEYDGNGKCILETYTYYAEDGATVEGTSTTTYTYDDNGLCTSELRENGEGRRYTYNADGLLISEVYVFEDGTESDPIAYQWIFDDNGRLLEGKRQKFTYDENGRKTSYFEAENTDGAGKAYAYTYDAFDRVININVVVKETRWNSELQRHEVYTRATGENSYVYAESGELISASLFEWDYDVGEYVNNTYNYATIE